MVRRKKNVVTDAVEILHRRDYEGRPEPLAELEEARASAAIARAVHGLRSKAKLSQEGLAQRVDVAPDVIATSARTIKFAARQFFMRSLSRGGCVTVEVRMRAQAVRPKTPE